MKKFTRVIIKLMVTAMLIMLVGVVMMIISYPAKAQARIGYSPQEIREEFKDRFTVESGKTDNGIRYVTVEHTDFLAAHYMDDNNTCVMSVIIPRDNAKLHGLIEHYNSRHVIINQKTWRAYLEGGVLECTLVNNDGGYFFIWKPLDE
jgi:hypothetical protein